jgi:SEC-C motif-containing protein
MAKKKNDICVCGSGKTYSTCCGHYIEGGDTPRTPEELMRSRYTAYALNNDSYLLSTWHSSTRPTSLDDEKNLPVKWVELRVLNATAPGPEDVNATVEFIARYKVNGKAKQLHEVSEFLREGERWYYLQGKFD